MKRLLSSNSGMTLIEIVLAMMFLAIIAGGILLQLEFSGVAMNHAGINTGITAAARTTTNGLLATPVNPNGTSVDATINWKTGTTNPAGSTETTVSVIHDQVEIINSSNKKDGGFNLYRRFVPDPPAIKIPSPLMVHVKTALNTVSTYEFITYNEPLTFDDISPAFLSDITNNYNCDEDGNPISNGAPKYWRIAHRANYNGLGEEWYETVRSYKDYQSNVWDPTTEKLYGDAYLIPCW